VWEESRAEGPVARGPAKVLIDHKKLDSPHSIVERLCAFRDLVDVRRIGATSVRLRFPAQIAGGQQFS
jgi:hypothetical protein